MLAVCGLCVASGILLGKRGSVAVIVLVNGVIGGVGPGPCCREEAICRATKASATPPQIPP